MTIGRFYTVLQQLALPRTRWFIIGAHVLLLAAIYAHQGVLADKEALKYIGCAEDVLQGDFRDLTGNYLKYGSYVLFLLPFVAADMAPLAIVAQILIGIIAAEALAHFTERITRNVAVGRLAMALFLLCPMIAAWTLTLYTEHFFTCMAVIFIEHLDRSTKTRPSTVAAGLVTLFARPVGMFFVVPALLWKWRPTLPAALRAWLVPGGCVSLFFFAIGFPRIEPAQLAPIASGQVIAGIGGSSIDGFDGHTISAAQLHLITQVGAVEWNRITVRRAASLFTLTRPYYSLAHNGLNMVFYLLFPLALFGWWKWRRNGTVGLVSGVLCLNILLVAITHDEWSGRFLVPLLPWIIVLAVLPFGRPRAGLAQV